MNTQQLNSQVTKQDVDKWQEDLWARIELMTMDFSVPEKK